MTPGETHQRSQCSHGTVSRATGEGSNMQLTISVCCSLGALGTGEVTRQGHYAGTQRLGRTRLE